MTTHMTTHLMLYAFISLSLSCSAAKKSESHSQQENTADQQDIDKSDQDQLSSEDSQGEELAEQDVQPPTIVTGSHLTGLNYDNARARCDYTQQSFTKYTVNCYGAILAADGSELRATYIEPGVEIEWLPLETTENVKTTSCKIADDLLSQVCDVELAGTQLEAELTVKLEVTQPEQKLQRVESTTVQLPYSVGISGGAVPSIPFTFKPGTIKIEELAAANDEVERAIPAGFQLRKLNPKHFPFNGIFSACKMNDWLYFPHSSFIYRVKGDHLELFAGSANNYAIDNTSHRFRKRFGIILNLRCVKDTLYVGDYFQGQIVTIKESGKVDIIAGGGGSELASPDGTPARGSTLGVVSDLEVGADGRVYFAEYMNSAIRMIDEKGLLQTIVGSHGEQGNQGIGGLAKDALIGHPHGIDLDKDGNLYFTDVSAHSVKRVNKDGILARISHRIF